MDLEFSLPEIFAVVASVYILFQISGDGETNWIEGVQLLSVYLILGILFFYLPEATEGSPTPHRESETPALSPISNAARTSAPPRPLGFLKEWIIKQTTAMQMQESATLKAGQGCANGTCRSKSRKSIT